MRKSHCSHYLACFWIAFVASSFNAAVAQIGGYPPPGPAEANSAPAYVASLPYGSPSPTVEKVSEMKQFAPGVLVAVINEEYVLAGDLLVLIEPQLREAKKQVSESQLAEIREKMMRQALTQIVQSKMLAQYFINEQVEGKSLSERTDARRQMDKRITEAFHKELVPRMMESMKVDNLLELDRMLREEGSSLEGQKRVFKDSAFAEEARKKHVPKKFEIDLISMRDYYESHLEEFRRPARARFRELTALTSKSGSREEADRLIRQMGDEVFLGGTPFEAVAKRSSHGSRAAQGGVYDWVTQGSLKNENLDAAIFAIPLNRLSNAIEDSDGFRIVEVLEREPERIVPFEEAQDKIREVLSTQRAKQAKDQLVETLKRKTSIWSRWPNDIPGALPLSELVPNE
jgi:parvulin-like peptidyl-prolyl isomerase